MWLQRRVLQDRHPRYNIGRLKKHAGRTRGGKKKKKNKATEGTLIIFAGPLLLPGFITNRFERADVKENMLHSKHGFLIQMGSEINEFVT